VLEDPGHEPREFDGQGAEKAIAEEPGLVSSESGQVPAGLNLRGRVVDAGMGIPIEHVSVRITGGEDSRAIWKLKTETDHAGAFEVTLPVRSSALGRMCGIHVTDHSNASLYSGCMLIADELLIRLPSQLFLRGRLVANADLANREVSLVAYQPAGSTIDVPQFLGRTSLDPSGQFSLSIRPRLDCDSVLLVFSSRGISFGVTSMPVSDLTSNEGATISLDLGRLVFRVADESGSAISGAMIRTRLVSRPSLPPSSGITDSAGSAEFLFPAGVVQYCVGASGFVPQVGTIASAAGSRALSLRRLMPEDRIVGRVLSTEDKSIAGAQVTAWPAEAAWGVGSPGMLQTRTDENGEFELPSPKSEKLRFIAVQVGFAEGAPILADGESGPVTLYLGISNTLQVQVRGAPGSAPSVHGSLQYYLVDRVVDRTMRGFAGETVFSITSIPDGDYNLLVFGGAEAYGETSVSLEASKSHRSSVIVFLRESEWLSGIVSTTNGDPIQEATVVADHPEWPPELSENWKTARTDSNGFFRLPAGSRSSATAHVYREGKEIGEGILVRGGLATIIGGE